MNSLLFKFPFSAKFGTQRQGIFDRIISIIYDFPLVLGSNESVKTKSLSEMFQFRSFHRPQNTYCIHFQALKNDSNV